MPQPLFQNMPFENGWYYVGSATQGRDYIMIQSQSFEARSRQGLVGLAQAPSPQESARILLFTTVSAQARPEGRPPTEKEDHEGMLRSGVPPLCPVWVVLRRARLPRREANHDGMLRSAVPRGDVTSPRSGWFCAGPDPLGEKQITRACSVQGCRAEA